MRRIQARSASVGKPVISPVVAVLAISGILINSTNSKITSGGWDWKSRNLAPKLRNINTRKIDQSNAVNKGFDRQLTTETILDVEIEMVC